MEPKLGLAISGGGIRSATFALGILQGLAKRKFLSKLDYLSTVSGGGYIGAWMSVWASRLGGIKVVESQLHPEWKHTGSDRSDVAPLSWLRAYGKFLSPKSGLFSADTWLIFAIWSRNTLLNLCVLIPLLLCLLCLPWVGLDWMLRLHQSVNHPLLLLVALGLLTLAAGFYSFAPSIPSLARLLKLVPELRGWGAAVLVSVSSLFFTAAVWRDSCHLIEEQWVVAGVGGVISLLCMGHMLWDDFAPSLHRLTAGLREAVKPPRAEPDQPPRNFKADASPLFAGLRLAFGAAFGGLALWFVFTRSLTYLMSAGQVWLLFAAPIFALADCLILVALIGVAGRRMSDDSREGWSRAGAWIGIFGFLGIVLSAISYAGPPAVAFAYQMTWVGVSTGTLWAAISAAGTYLARGQATSGDENSKSPWLDAALPLAGLVFIVGFLIILSFLVFSLSGDGHLLAAMKAQAQVNKLFIAFHTDADLIARSVCTVILAVGCLLSWAVLGRVFSINDFSMFSFYRNRLVRAYLGASNLHRDETVEAFADLCPTDDVPLSALDPIKVGYTHLFCTAANVNLDRSGFAERKAVSFVFDHKQCGYSLPPTVRLMTANEESHVKSYPSMVPTVGTAMTISGAAASPNMGYHSSPILAFLMTLFNVRLGYWMFNPSGTYSSWKSFFGWPRDVWEPRGPKLGTLYYLFELLAQASSKRKYLYLSDGGHFENLGLYELLRLELPFIIAIDGECDPSMKFEAFAGVLRKARSDFGAEISIDTSSIEERTEDGWSASHAAVGSISYRRGNKGCLLYLKLSVTGDEPQDILNYRKDNAEFPHQTTADQFFSESQFESYRRLGLHVADRVLSAADADSREFQLDRRDQLADFFGCLRQTLMPIPRAIAENFTRHSGTLKTLLGELQHEPLLDPIARQIACMANASTLAEDTPSFRACFFFAQRLIQLMEDVYFDLQLESNFGHLSCQGWMKQFESWVECSVIVQLTYSRTKATFTPAFQSFFDRRLAPMKQGEQS